MRYFYDTEFYERGPAYPITLISIGVVCEDGRELYRQNIDVDPSQLSDWLKENVVPHLSPEAEYWGTLDTIKQDLLAFVGDDPHPVLVGYYSSYDHVVLAQLYGAMINMPKTWPLYTFDLKQVIDMVAFPDTLVPEQEGVEHNALEDARWNWQLWQALAQYIIDHDIQVVI